jgi:hypothetical protein
MLEKTLRGWHIAHDGPETPVEMEQTMIAERGAIRHHIFTDLAEMLAPETLSEILSKPVEWVECAALNGHGGLAGGMLDYVDTNVGRFVLKRMHLDSDYIMFISNDHQGRAVRLWQYGLLDRLLPHLEHKILACSQDHDGWAILMHDLSGKVYTWDKAMPVKLVPAFLDALARLHSIFWADPLLNDERLGLCDSAGLLEQTSLELAQGQLDQSKGVLPDWIVGGWEVMKELLDPQVFELMSSLEEDPLPLVKALRRYPYTLLHGDYRAENLAYVNGYPVALDWQNAGCSLMTIDLIWFTKHGYVCDTFGQDQAINYYRQRLEAYLGKRFDEMEWLAMIGLGYLVDALRSLCFTAYWYKHTDNPQHRRWNLKDVKKRSQYAKEAMRWLSGS